jgi:hypothetical protein
MRVDRLLPEPQRKAIRMLLKHARAVEGDRNGDVHTKPFYMTRADWLELAYQFEGVSTS